jgi:hypothetical protein
MRGRAATRRRTDGWTMIFVAGVVLAIVNSLVSRRSPA